MIRVPFEEMRAEFKRVLLSKGVDQFVADICSEIFAESSLDGIYSHGVNRFPRLISYIDKGYVDVNATPVRLDNMGAFERWDGRLGLGSYNATLCMERAMELADEYGIGCVAIRNTNHWMRGGTYGWQAARKGYAAICWTNTLPNMPAWGAKDCRLGNNPMVLAVPGENPVVVDTALAQYSYGKLEETRIAEKKLQVAGGYDEDGKLTDDPAKIEATMRPLPIGYWKGSAISIVLDMAVSILADGNASGDIGKLGDEYSVSQIFILFNVKKFGNRDDVLPKINNIIDYIKGSTPVDSDVEIRYPGERAIRSRKDNMENGIPVKKYIWDSIKKM